MNRMADTNKKILIIGSLVCLCLIFAAGRIGQSKAQKKDEAALSSVVNDADLASSIREKGDQTLNSYTKLWVPTSVRTIGDLVFLVDSYHNQMLVNTEEGFSQPLNQWQTLPGEFNRPHTIAGDREVYLADDTENNRVEVFLKSQDSLGEIGTEETELSKAASDPAETSSEKSGSPDNVPEFTLSQVFTGVGSRPHFTWYDQDTGMFYVWSSQTGEMYMFSRKEGSGQKPQLQLKAIHKFDEMKDTYVRSFTVADGSIYFVSGVSLGILGDNSKGELSGYKPQILQYSMPELKLEKSYDVPDEIAGMVQMIPDGKGGWYFSVSTDRSGSQDAEGFFYTANLSQLCQKDGYQESWKESIPGGGVPYFFDQSDGVWQTVCSGNSEHSLWRFKIEDGKIKEPEGFY